MTEYREKLLERVIRVYGFEHEVTIGFARLCENPDFSDACLEALCIAHECFPYYGVHCLDFTSVTQSCLTL